jgi:hypothetical protein
MRPLLLSRFVFGACVTAGLMLSSSTADAQQYSPAGPPPPAYAPATPYDSTVPPMPPPAGPSLNQALATLTDQPASHTGFTFDRSMLQMAQGYLTDSGMDAKRAAAALTSVSYDNFHYKAPAFYVPESMAALMNSYKAAGWMHLIDHSSRNAANSAEPKNGVTDMWLHFNGANIDAVTVLHRGPTNMNVVQVTGDLRPLDLMHISGHFGIPKVDPNVVMGAEK